MSHGSTVLSSGMRGSPVSESYSEIERIIHELASPGVLARNVATNELRPTGRMVDSSMGSRMNEASSTRITFAVKPREFYAAGTVSKQSATHTKN